MLCTVSFHCVVIVVNVKGVKNNFMKGNEREILKRLGTADLEIKITNLFNIEPLFVCIEKLWLD